jgi:cytochrome c-type biogenesis protein CcmH
VIAPWRQRTTAVAIALATFGLLALTPTATAAPARASLMDVENDVMCVVCDEPLAVAQSPQAYRERNFIRGLIAQGYTKAQIERQLVTVYGPAVLGRPPAHGFNLTVYVLPPAALVAGLALLAFTLPRWRRRVRAQAAENRAGPSLTPAEQQRLEDELSHFAG